MNKNVASMEGNGFQALSTEEIQNLNGGALPLVPLGYQLGRLGMYYLTGVGAGQAARSSVRFFFGK